MWPSDRRCTHGRSTRSAGAQRRCSRPPRRKSIRQDVRGERPFGDDLRWRLKEIERTAHRALNSEPGYSSFEGIEINGTMLAAHVKAFRLFPSHALALLAKNGIGTVQSNGEVAVDYQCWYAMDRWLKAFDSILAAVGPNMGFDIGQAVPKHAQLPPDVKDIHASIRAVDIGYPMNHRRAGRLMFNPATGQMLEGIGHYGYKPVPGERKIVSLCENPYPCTFDQGILTSFARKFEPSALILHADSGPCRAKGGASCTYTIRW